MAKRRRTDNTMAKRRRADLTTFWRYKEVIRIRNSMKNRQHNVFKISKGWSGSVNRGRTDNIGFWFPLWYLQDSILSALLWYTDSDYPFGIFKTLCCLFFFDIRILITPLYLQDIMLSVLLWCTDIRIRISKMSRKYNVLKIPKG
jgi:hypothetical protein